MEENGACAKEKKERIWNKIAHACDREKMPYRKESG